MASAKSSGKQKWNPPVGKKQGKGGALAGPTPWAVASKDRTPIKGDKGTELETDFKDLKANAAGKRVSSYPHLTPATDKRAEHVTNIRVIATNVAGPDGAMFTVHERFHQDNVAGTEPTHDRFIASDAKGNVFNATSDFKADAHVATRFRTQPLTKGGPIVEDKRREVLAFTIGAAAGNHPPLSPRSRTRTFP